MTAARFRSVHLCSSLTFIIFLFSTTIPMAVRMYPEKASLITTGVQVGVGCGLCLGPPIGSLLIPMGGYKCPFLVIGCTEFVVFTLSWLAIPANRVQSTSTKFRPSDYIRYLCRFSTLSEIVPTAALFCIPGIRDSAYSLFFEDVIGVDKTKVGYLFMFNSADVFISGPIIGFLVEKGMGTIIGVASQIFTLLVAFALYLPHLVPGLETVAWCAMILACNGLIMSSTLNPGYLILEKIAIRQGFSVMFTSILKQIHWFWRWTPQTNLSWFSLRGSKAALTTFVKIAEKYLICTIDIKTPCKFFWSETNNAITFSGRWYVRRMFH